MAQREICVIKQTKRSEREEDIRPLIFRWEIQRENIWLQLAAGSKNNLKPDLVMDTFLSVCAIPEDSVSFAYHRLEMYADKGKDGERNLVSLESLGQEISM